MLPYDKAIMQRLMAEDAALKQKCDVIGESHGNPIYLAYMGLDTSQVERYNVLHEVYYVEPPVASTPDTPLIAEIRRLVNTYGWQDFVKSLALYACKKEAQMRQLKMFSDSYIWHAICDQFQKIRKRVQL